MFMHVKDVRIVSRPFFSQFLMTDVPNLHETGILLFDGFFPNCKNITVESRSVCDFADECRFPMQDVAYTLNFYRHVVLYTHIVYTGKR